MNSKKGIVELEGGSLSYKIIGTGPQPLLCFHGFGQNKEKLVSLASVWEKKYTLYIFDIFHHGESFLEEGKVLSNEYLKNLFTIFLNLYTIQKFSVLGFSIGAKLALSLVYIFPEQILKLYLLGPDGLKKNLWYQLATSTMVGRKLFYQIIHRHKSFAKFLRFFTHFKLIPGWLEKFVYLHLLKNNNAEKIYKTWISFRKLNFFSSDLSIKINTHRIHVLIFIGIFDKLLKKEDILPFANKINSCNLYTLPCGHSNLIEATSSYIRQNLI